MEDTGLDSRDWQDMDTDGVSGCFIEAGFRHTGEILDTAVFDLLNTDRLDCGRVEEMVLALYRWYSPDPEEELPVMDRRWGRWRREHGDLSAVTVRDIVAAECADRKAVLHYFGLVVRAFHRSDEYDGREYKYSDYRDYPRRKKDEQKGKD